MLAFFLLAVHSSRHSGYVREASGAEPELTCAFWLAWMSRCCSSAWQPTGPWSDTNLRGKVQLSGHARCSCNHSSPINTVLFIFNFTLIIISHDRLLLLQEVLVHPRRGGEAAEARQQQQPPPLRVVAIVVPPHLVDHLGQDLVPQPWRRQAPLDDVVPKHVLLRTVEVRVPHEPQHLGGKEWSGSHCSAFLEIQCYCFYASCGDGLKVIT